MAMTSYNIVGQVDSCEHPIIRSAWALAVPVNAIN